MKNRLLFIYNPNAGKKAIKDKLLEIINNLTDENMELIVSPTKKRGDAEVRVIEYENDLDCEMIICSGGDGTLHEVVSGMMKRVHRVPIVYIPTGSTNDFGVSLNIPKDMVVASDMAKFGMPFPIDVASLNHDYFVYTCCFGLFTETSYATPQAAKNVLGHFAYILKGSTELAKIKKYHMKVEYDDKVITDTFIFGMVCSTSSVGGFKGITGKDVRFDDGYYEMILIKDGSMLDIIPIVNDLLKGNHTHERVIYARVNKVKFTSEKEVAWCVDGEFAGNLRTADIKINQRAVTLMI